MTPLVHIVNVFADGPGGGNPAPTVADASGMSDDEMREVARSYGHESGFVLPPPENSGCDFAFRFWVPNHEMEMCGHATVGAAWLLHRLGKLPRAKISIATLGGRVEAQVTETRPGGASVQITQPQGRVEALPEDAEAEAEAEILHVLGITSQQRSPFPIRNACTSRVKTLIPLTGAAALDGLRPDFALVENLCERIGSTGLYPFAPSDLSARVFDARQFPKSSGYPEDAATGIAAAALAFGLLENGLVATDAGPITVRQGRAMGRPSKITLRFRLDADGKADGCWLGGDVRMEDAHE